MQLPNFGLIYGAVLWILIFLFSIVMEPHHYYGLPIELRTANYVRGQKNPWQETLGVYLAVGEKYYINGRAVRQAALGASLQQELSHRESKTFAVALLESDPLVELFQILGGFLREGF